MSLVPRNIDHLDLDDMPKGYEDLQAFIMNEKTELPATSNCSRYRSLHSVG